MTIYSEILGNIRTDADWEKRIDALPDVEYVHLDQWMAQKSRFLGRGDKGGEYPVALKRQSQIKDGDVIAYDPEHGRAVVLRLDLNPVLEVDLSALAQEKPEVIIRHAVELGHAIGNQHWPAVVKDTKVYVPLTVDKKVMLSVMETHHIEDISYRFIEGTEVIPWLAPHEVRRLFGGAGHESHSHVHPHPQANGAIVEADGHRHVITHSHDGGPEHTHLVTDYDAEAASDESAGHSHVITHSHDGGPEHTHLVTDYDAEQYPEC